MTTEPTVTIDTLDRKGLTAALGKTLPEWMETHAKRKGWT